MGLAEKSGLADRRGGALLAELEESRALLDSADRGKKQADVELVAARGSVNDMTAINGKAAADKRKMESLVHTLHAEIDDALSQAKGSEEKAKRAMVDAARLADELRAEQDHTAALEKNKGGLNGAMGELELNWHKPMKVLPRVVATPWPSLKPASVSLKLSLDPSKPRLARPSSPSKRLSVTSRNFNSKPMRTRRTKIACLY